ncbi:MAG: RagB/SusD family nutrient uptake outer membrane protein [Paludibacteraceae bacterium]|nr:RagB/SusD family nutrient uptake outer membrane protein [Paludibacteraceae bacterium]
MKKNIVVITLIAALSLTSCKDFFEINNPQTLSQANFPSTMEQVNQLVTAAYAQNHAFGLYAFYWFPMGVYLYDHTTDLYGSYDERAFSQDNYSTPESRYLTTSYTDICKWASLSTAALEGIERYSQSASSAEKDQLAYMRGQCLFNRALAYWHGQIFFEMDANGLGMPIINEVLSDAEKLKRPRSSVKDCWQFMITDLEEACALLKGHTEDLVNGEYRVTYWGAMGLLAKVYMQSLYIFPDNKTKAKTVMEEIINESGKTLASYEVYSDMFYGNEQNEHNCESLYEITMTTDYTQDGPWAGYTTGSGMAVVYAPWYTDLNIRFRKGREDKTDPLTLEDDIITSTKSSQWGNNFIHDKNIARFGFWHFHGDTVPRWTFNHDFDYSAKRSRANFPYALADATYRDDALALKNDKSKVDPRIMLCAGQPYVDAYINASGDTTWYDRSSEVNNRPDILAWQHRKYTNTRGVEMGPAPYGKNESSDCNIYIVRLADIYLLYAELMATENPALALEYVNKVHARAYGDDDSYNYTSLTDRTKAYFDEDPLANDVIRYERWAELFAEGQWWMDVRRYRLGNAEADYYKETRHGAITWKGDCSYVQPIPQLEIERNENIQQTTGY